MLLFIRSEEKERITLSIVSIHLMLLFIEAAGRGRNRQGQVSIHLMLLFILISETFQRAGRGFNTSHVVIYQN